MTQNTKRQPFTRGPDGRYSVEDYPWLATYRAKDYPFAGESEVASKEILDDSLLALAREIKRAAKSVAFQWPGVIDADDVEQDIYLRLLGSPGSVEKIGKMEDRAKYRAIVGMGHQIASAERNDYDYFKGSYRYSVHEAKDVLKQGILVEPLDGFNEVAFDLTVALGVLEEKSPQYADAIKLRYEKDTVPQDTSAKSALSRGLGNLVNEMNRSHRVRFSERDEGPGTRKVIRNALADKLSRDQYSGEELDWEYAKRTEGKGWGDAR